MRIDFVPPFGMTPPGSPPPGSFTEAVAQVAFREVLQRGCANAPSFWALTARAPRTSSSGLAPPPTSCDPVTTLPSPSTNAACASSPLM